MKQVRSKQPARGSAADLHPIAVIAERTGLTQDVLRVWERRYGAVDPKRSPTGQRVYTDADLERLRLLHAATRAGRSIGQIARLSDKALTSMVKQDAVARAERVSAAGETIDDVGLIDTALSLAQSLQSRQLDDHLRRASAMLGLPEFLSRVAAPLLRRIGDEWHAGSFTPAQEHFASSALYDIIVERMRAFAPRDDAPRILIATPAGERHAIGAALVGAGAAVEGWRVIYLGADLPAEEIVAAAIASNVAVVALSVLYVEDRERVIGELRAVRSRLPMGIPLFVGGSGALTLARELSAPGIRVSGNVAELYDELRRSQ
jgi:DNA-binding transcriptional MerR regulator/methylmalonyl-CoA mutase cobalamin-binding subunit